MILPLKDLIIFGIGFVLLALWLIIFFASVKYDSIFEGLDENEYRLKNLYSTGYAVMELIRYDYTAKRDRKFRQEIEILYGKQYTEYYLRVTYARAVTYVMLFVLSTFILYGLSGELMILPFGLFYSAIFGYYFMTLTSKQVKKKSDELSLDFSEVVTKMALLLDAGSNITEAWADIAKSGEGAFYEEMRKTLTDINEGTPLVEAIRLFGARCVLPEIKKFSSTIIQGIELGNRSLAMMLQQQSSEVWNARKQHARREGEKAATKLLAPMVLMFMGIIIMIVIPIFANLGA